MGGYLGALSRSKLSSALDKAQRCCFDAPSEVSVLRVQDDSPPSKATYSTPLLALMVYQTMKNKS
jgi:hypothetical protein